MLRNFELSTFPRAQFPHTLYIEIFHCLQLPDEFLFLVLKFLQDFKQIFVIAYQHLDLPVPFSQLRDHFKVIRHDY